MEKQTKSAPKKSNRTTEIIIGQAAMNLDKAVASISTAFDEVKKLNEMASTGSLRVVELEDTIGGLEQDLKNKQAQNKIELENQYKADEKSFVAAYCGENGMALVPKKEFEELKLKLEDATTNMNSNIQKAVGAATSAMKKDHDNAIAMAKLEFEKKEADNLAVIKQNAEQIKFLNEQVGYWKKGLEDERAAGIERAKAASIGTLNVGASNGR